MTHHTPTVDEVLDQLALESVLNSQTVRRYIDAYPEFTGAILDFTLECQLPDDMFDSPTVAMEAAGDRLLDGLMAAHGSTAPSSNPLAVVTVASVEKATGIAGPLVDAMRKGMVLVDSIPDVIARKLVALLCLTREELFAGLSIVGGANVALEHKAVGKPSAGRPMPFDHFLDNSGLTEEEKRSTLME
ncbi:hypothetical protein [Manganibacter manganicus]|uniref:Uncharacterized protein n=1 Tax=Manganibacter manganicus TaxID=1873176 RepID=A0A1V8RJG3_9HYPH|nr:hypothetical protein [Pseudaminobacter manganicus]OQM73347.1 hypothetical protein BFN67_08540 [Pseudaminobacter manganicus]